MRERLERAWAAGFFDGEGCVGMVKHKGSAYARHTLQLSLGQSGSDETLLRFQKAVGGRGTIYGPYHPSNPKHKVHWKWYVHGDEARVVMKLLKPYLSSVKLTKYAVVEPQCAKAYV